MRPSLAAATLLLSVLAAPALGQAPQRGGTLDFGIVFEPPTSDCHAGNTFAVLHAVSPHYSTLLKLDLENYPKVTGDLAAIWSVSDDRKTYTFKLKPNVKFHDGTVLTSADVKASYDRLRDPPQGVISIRKALFSDISGVETPDPATVVFRLKDVNAAMETMFALPWNCIYSAAKLMEDQTSPAKIVMGTGPFRFVEHVRGSHWVGQRFDDYHVPGRPYLDGFRATFIPNPSAMLNAIQGGAVRAEFRGLTPNERDRLVDALGPRIRSEESSEPTVLLITFNTQKKPFDDVRVRRALTMAIDRHAASEGLQKQSRMKSVGGLMRPGSPFATSETELEKFPGFGRNVEAARTEARRLLKEAGAENLSFVLTNRNNPPYTTGGVYALDQWRRIGVTVEHRPVETAAWTQALTSGSFDAIMDFGSDVVDEPSLRLAKHISSDRSPQNAARVVDRELDRLYDEQGRATDLDERTELVRQFESRWLDEAASVPFLWMQRIVATYSDVRGWSMSPSNSLGQDLAGVWLAR